MRLCLTDYGRKRMHRSLRSPQSRQSLAIITLASLAVYSKGSIDAACSDHSDPACVCGAPNALYLDHTGHSHGLLPAQTRGGGGLGSQATQTVWVYNFDYSINQSGGPIVDATINAGDTIRWEWETAGFHTVTSVSGSSQSYNSGG